MERKKKKLYNLLISIMYFFRQVIYYVNPANGYFLAGNLDAFYLFAPVYAMKKIKKIKKISKQTLIFIVTCIGYLIVQIIFIRDLNIFRAIINVAKIIICYFVMQYVKEYYYKFNTQFICKTFSILCVIFLIIAIAFPNSILWRHNDLINKYDLNRLQFLYTEPSELGFHAIIITLLYVFIIINTKDIKKILVYTIFSIPVIGALYFAKPMGAIGVGAVSIFVLCMADLIINFSKQKLVIYMILLILAMVILGYLIYSENSLYLRIMDTFAGKDMSNRYRIMVPFNVSKQAIIDTRGIGIGFGNAELENNVAKYSHLGLAEQGIINSYMNLISEGGIFGIALIGITIVKMLQKSIKEKSTIKLALSAFIISYQFMGTYFTNPLCWIIYGIILSDMDFNKILEKDEEISCEQNKNRSSISNIQ